MSGREEFSVYQWFAGTEQYEEVRRFVGAEEAVKTAHALISSVGGRIGTTRRVIITDGGDFTVFDWRYGEGIVFPPPEEAGRSTEILDISPKL
jgi:hypothetical protein